MRAISGSLATTIAITLLLLASPHTAVAAWIATPVDTASAPHGPVLAIDDAGIPHIGFRKDFRDSAGTVDSAHVRYASRVAGSWGVEFVSTTMGSISGLLAMALDPSQNPAIAFLDFPELTLATKNAGMWTMEVVDTLGAASVLPTVSVSLAFDSAGNPAVSYPVGAIISRNLHVATRTDGVWMTEPVIAAGGLGSNCESSLDIASDGSPAVAAWVGPSQLRFARKAAGAWTVETLVASGASRPSLALDAMDNPHIAYTGAGVIHAVKTGGVWSFETIGAGSNPSILIDSEDVPHVAYEAAGGIRYASRAGGVWTITPICVSGTDPSVALDRATYASLVFPAIAYRAPDSSLTYAVPDPTGVGDPSELDGRALLSAFPNPALNRDVHVSYRIPASGSFALSVFDLTGRRVRTLASGSSLAQAATIRWDGRDESGRAVGSGAYFLRLESGRASATERIMLIR